MLSMTNRGILWVALGVVFLLSLWAETASAQGMGPRRFGARGRSGTAILNRLAAGRPRVSDEVLEKARKLPLEAMWGAVQRHGYRHCFVGELKTTQPRVKLVGRAVTLRYLPVRPDLLDILETMGKETGRSHLYNIQAGDELKPGDVPVVELGGTVEAATFLGDVTALGMKTAGAAGAVIDGGTRDLEELLDMKNFPIYYRGAHASAMSDLIGVEWNLPVRIGKVTVFPGDMVVGDSSGVLIVPAQLAEKVVQAAAETVSVENFKRSKIREGKHKVLDIYPRMSPELEEEYRKTKRK